LTVFAFRLKTVPSIITRGIKMPSSQNNMQDLNAVEKPDFSHSSQMEMNANETTEFLKTLAHSGRLMILCRLAEGSASVGELENLLGIRQAAVSKQLSRLRDEGFVSYEREGRTIIYSLADERARKVIDVLYAVFCGNSENSN